MRQFFELNQPVIQFAYGLSFFMMGWSVALQSRSSSRLQLARGLAWLAAFAVMHSLYIWGELFSPVHEAYLSPGAIELLHTSHLMLLSISFGCLLEFGVAMLRPLGRFQWLRWLTGIWLAVYVLIIWFILPVFEFDGFASHASAEALARYTIGFPGGLLAAYALREQTFRLIAPLNAPHIFSMLRATGIALLLYALVGGLIPPPVRFFPGSLLNTESFEELVGVPPLVIQSLLSLLLAFSVIRALRVFQVETERRIEDMEQQQILAAERERIGRELHDGTIQTAYTAGLLVNSARNLAEPQSPLDQRLERAVTVLDEVISDLRRSMGELRNPPNPEPLPGALRKMTEDPRYRSLVDISLETQVPEDLSLSPQEAQHILSIVQEALSNIARHAHARQVQIALREQPGSLQLTIQDDGVGLPEQPKDGYGLRNMQDRARLLDGQLEVSGRPGKGTLVRLTIPDGGINRLGDQS